MSRSVLLMMFFGIILQPHCLQSAWKVIWSGHISLIMMGAGWGGGGGGASELNVQGVKVNTEE